MTAIDLNSSQHSSTNPDNLVTISTTSQQQLNNSKHVKRRSSSPSSKIIVCEAPFGLISSMKQLLSSKSISRIRSRRRNKIDNNTSNECLSNNNKSVQFAPTTKVKLTLSLNDMTPEEKRKSWIQEHEAISMEEDCKRLVRKVEKFGDRLGNGKTLVTRGLESHFQDRAYQKKLNRFMTRDEVLLEQEEQYARGCFDDEAIAAAYNSTGITSECQSQAEYIALLDQKEAKKYLLSSSSSSSKK